jgi:DNA-binding NarL/FixJ family response regulator
VRIVIADDSMLLRRGIASVLDEYGCEIVGEAEDADRAMAVVRTQQPDLAVLDIRMPPTNTDEGIRLAHEIREEFPSISVLVLSQYVEPSYALRLLGGFPSGMGYLLKERVFNGAVLYDALRRLADGECVIDPTIVAQFMNRKRKTDPIEALSDRELEVLALIAQGRSNAGIARELVIGERTVESHATHIFTKLGISGSIDDHRRVLAVLALLRSSD